MQVTRQELKEFFTLANENGVNFDFHGCMPLSIDDCIGLIVEHAYTSATIEAKIFRCPSPEAYLEWAKWLKSSINELGYNYEFPCCVGITKKGKRCKRILYMECNTQYTPKSNRYCFQHISQVTKLDNSEKYKGGTK